MRVSVPFVFIFTLIYSVKYEVTYDGPRGDVITTIGYGILEHIFVYELGQDRIWDAFRGRTLLLAVIKPFKTNGEDAAIETTHYTECMAPIVTDVRNIKSTVGRLETRKRWGLVDQDMLSAKVVFSLESDSDSSDDD